MALLLAASAAPVLAAHYETDDIVFSATPDPAYQHGRIALTGWVMPHPANRIVKVRLDGPEGRRVVEDIECAPDGNFAWYWGPLDELGTWRVRLKGPAKDEIADVSFEVVPAGGAPAAVVVSIAAACRAADLAIAELRTNLDAYPDVPGKDEALANAQEAQTHLSELASQVAELNAATTELAQAMADFPMPMPETSAVLAEMASEVQTQQAVLETHVAAMNAATREARAAHMWCRTWYMQGEAWKELIALANTALSLAENVFKWVATKVLDTLKSEFMTNVHTIISGVTLGGLPPEIREQAQGAYDRSVKACEKVDQVWKATGDGNWDGLIAEAAGLLIDWLIKDVTRHCEVYAGSLKGHMELTYYARNRPYIQARYDLEGKAELFFRARDGSGAPARLEGQFRGDAHRFRGSVDISHLVADVPGTTGIGFCIPRIDKRPFYGPVEGEAQGPEMTLRLKEFVRDFCPARFRFVFLIISAFQMVPIPDIVDMDVPGAEWFFTRVTSTAGDEKEFVLPITADGDTSRVKTTIERFMDYRDEAQFTGKLSVEFDLKSPPQADLGGLLE